MQATSPIGIFDSGVGGTSIWQEINSLLPYEDTIYLADSKYAPYGNKSQEEIIALSIKNTELLISLGCKLIVVACNTATTNAINTLRSKYEVPIIGIEPAIKPAALKTVSKSIGILATKGTLSSALFHATAKEYTKDISVIEIVGEGLVPLIEAGKIDGVAMTTLLEKYMQPMIVANIDHLVLGCSHYPYLIPQLKKILPTGITIIDSGAAVAKQTKMVLDNLNLLCAERRNPELMFYSNLQTKTLTLLLADYSEKIKIEMKDF